MVFLRTKVQHRSAHSTLYTSHIFFVSDLAHEPSRSHSSLPLSHRLMRQGKPT